MNRYKSIVKFNKYVFALLIPRLIIGVFFTNDCHFGYGGDPQIYHQIAVSFTDILKNDLDFNKNVIDLREEQDNELAKYWFVADNVKRTLNGDFWGMRNNTAPIVFWHIFFYYFFEEQFYYILFQILLTVAITIKIINKYKLDSITIYLLILNPFSLYYSSTHMKEGVLEPFFLLFLFYYLQKKYILSIFPLLIISFFRLEVLVLFLSIFILKYFFMKIEPILFIISCFFLIVILPYFGMPVYPEGSHIVHKIIYYNEFTGKTLGSIYGVLQPLPFFFNWNYEKYAGFFLNLQGVFNSILIFLLFKLTLDKNSRLKVTYKAWGVNAMWFVCIFMSYHSMGAIGMKERFISPFIPIFIILLSKKLELKNNKFKLE